MKKGAIELSIGTIVIVVLAMSMLILGMVLIRGIFSGVTDTSKMADDQIREELMKSWGEDRRLVIYPSTKQIEIKSGTERPSGIGIGIKNLLTGIDSSSKKFRYEVTLEDKGNCLGVSDRDFESLIILGKTMSPTDLMPGDTVEGVARITIPDGFPLCSFRYKVQAFYDGNNNYAVEFVDVTVKK